jgi:hypothetical protein
MKSSPPSQPIIHPVGIKNTERWGIYHRLQQLEIPCRCSTNQPLEVELDHPSAIAQLCYVVKQSTASRSELVDWLDDCWKITYRQRKSDSVSSFGNNSVV